MKKIFSCLIALCSVGTVLSVPVSAEPVFTADSDVVYEPTEELMEFIRETKPEKNCQ